MGVVAGDAGFTEAGAVLMSLLVFSGSAQMIAVDMQQQGAGLVAILISTVLVSIRYILMGMTMSGWFRSAPRWMFWPGIHYLSDQSWAMTVNQMRSGRRDIGYFFGLNAGMLVCWVVGTAVGVSVGEWLGESVNGLHFASTAALVGILAEMKVRRQDVLPWIVAAIAAILAHALIEGSWYMMIGVVAGLGTSLVMGDDDA
jgi:4-azaleucine resistance transporter AzlC